MCLILAGSSSLTILVREAATKRPLQPRQPIRAGWYAAENWLVTRRVRAGHRVGTLRGSRAGGFTGGGAGGWRPLQGWGGFDAELNLNCIQMKVRPVM